MILYKYLFKSLLVSSCPFKNVYDVTSGPVLSALNVLPTFNLYCSPYEVGITIILTISSLFLFFLRGLSLREIKSRSPSRQVAEAASKPRALLLPGHPHPSLVPLPRPGALAAGSFCPFVSIFCVCEPALT